MTPDLIHRDGRAITAWLFLCAGLVALMVLVGGYTRLSGSGLSITEWRPIHGALPPMTESHWQEDFAAYQASPQYRQVNAGMTLGEFKTIFWPEFIHRLLGRAIGVVFLLPLLVFAARRSLSRRFGGRLAAIFALGGLQGLIGWLMVKSGLVNDPNVSHLRLALHLGVAFALFAALLWAGMDVVVPRASCLVPRKLRGTRHEARGTYLPWFLLLCLQITLGAFMAGLHAGHIYNSWPGMNGQFLPAEALNAGRWWANIPMIQFMHRNVAVLVALGFAFWWYCERAYVKKNHLGLLCFSMLTVIAIQFTLGVLTLLWVVPLPLALAHQMTALLLFALGVRLLYQLCHPARVAGSGATDGDPATCAG